MRVLFINSIGRNKWGGGEKWMINAAKGLQSRGHSVTIACLPKSELQSRSEAADIAVIPIRIYTDFSIGGYVALQSFLRQNEIDVIIGCQNKDVRLAGLFKKISKKRLVVLSRQGVELLHDSVKYKYTFVPYCDGIITNTISIKSKYDSFGWWNSDEFVKVIHNGVEKADETIEAFDYRTLLPKDVKDPLIVLSTGRLTEQKGFKYLIKGAKDVIKANKHIHIFIAGKGKYAAELKTLVKQLGLESNIHLIGFRTDIPALLKGADLFILPSLYEGMPNSVMEAMAHGVPVISTDVNGVRELMVHKKHGLIIPPADPLAIKRALNELITQNSLLALGSEGKRHVQSNFLISKMIENLENYLLSKMQENKLTQSKQKFLIVQTAFIGDVILATPVIEKLKRFYPDAQIDILVRKGNEGILKHNPHINQVVIFNKEDGKYKNMMRLIRQFRTEKYDVIINIQRYLTTGIITALSKAKQTIGFDKNPMSFAFTHKIPHKMGEEDTSDHEVKRNLLLTEHLCDDAFEMPKMYPSDEDFEKVRQDKPYYCMAPTSVWFTKQYPAEKWIELMNQLPKETRILVLGGAGDKTECQGIIDQSTHPDIINMAGQLSFTESAALMKHARMNFVNDSAPLHLCSAVNAPVRAMFCSTVPAYGYTPLSDNSKVLETSEELECRPCGLHGKKACPEGHFKCGNIPVSTVISSL